MTDCMIVDANDVPIGAKNRQDKSYDDIYRVSALWLTDKLTGDVLLAQRKWTKKNDPGKWAAAAAGTVEPDETYDTNIVKEIQEEIGLHDVALSVGPKVFVDDGKNQFFCQWFFGVVDKNQVRITIQEQEVEAIKWVSIAWLVADVAKNGQNYVPSMARTLVALGIA